MVFQASLLEITVAKHTNK